MDQQRNLEIENAKLTAKLEVAEKALERANLERSRVQNDAALAKAQSDEHLLHSRRTEAAQKETIQRLESEVQSLRQETRRGNEQAEKYALETRKKLNELEIDRDKQLAAAAGFKKALETKNAEIDRIVRESEFTKENLERVVRELAERAKRLEEDARRKGQQSDRDVEDLLKEHQRTTAELLDARRTAQTLADDARMYESQISNLKHVNQDLIEELDTLKRRQRSLEADLDDARAHADGAMEREAAAKEEVNELIEKLAKADAHMQKLAQQAEDLQIDNIKLKHEMELYGEDVSHAKRDKDELVARLTPFMTQVAEDTDRVTSLLDSLLVSISALASLNSSNIHVPLKSESGAGAGGDANGNGRGFSCWPRDGTAGSQASTPEGTLIVCSMRLRDALALIAEDILMVQRGVQEETYRKRDGIKKDVVLEEGLQAEREHILDLAQKLGEAESKLDQAESQRKALENALTDSSQWMAEAVSLQEDRTRRVESLIAEKEALQASVAALEGRIVDLTAALRQSKDETEAERDAVRKSNADAKAAQRSRQAADEEVAQCKRQVHAVKSELADREQDIQKLKAAAASREEAFHRLDTDVRYLRRQLEDAATKARVKDEQIANLEGREHQLRDQLYEAQKRLDAALRGGSGSSAVTAVGTNATLPQPTTGSGIGLTSPLAAYRPSRTAASTPGESSANAVATSLQQRLVTGRQSPTRYSDPVPALGSASAAAGSRVSPTRRASPAATSTSANAAATSLAAASRTGSATASWRTPSAASTAAATGAPSVQPTSNSSSFGVGLNRSTPVAAETVTDSATTERLKAWESRINSLLANSRGGSSRTD